MFEIIIIGIAVAFVTSLALHLIIYLVYLLSYFSWKRTLNKRKKQNESNRDRGRQS